MKEESVLILERIIAVPRGATTARLQLRLVGNAIVPELVFDLNEKYAFAVVIEHDDPQARAQLQALIADVTVTTTVT